MFVITILIVSILHWIVKFLLFKLSAVYSPSVANSLDVTGALYIKPNHDKLCPTAP